MSSSRDSRVLPTNCLHHTGYIPDDLQTLLRGIESGKDVQSLLVNEPRLVNEYTRHHSYHGATVAFLPLHWAALRGNSEHIQALLANKAKLCAEITLEHCRVPVRDGGPSWQREQYMLNPGETALDVAILHKDFQSACILLAATVKRASQRVRHEDSGPLGRTSLLRRIEEAQWEEASFITIEVMVIETGYLVEAEVPQSGIVAEVLLTVCDLVFQQSKERVLAFDTHSLTFGGVLLDVLDTLEDNDICAGARLMLSVATGARPDLDTRQTKQLEKYINEQMDTGSLAGFEPGCGGCIVS